MLRFFPDTHIRYLGFSSFTVAKLLRKNISNLESLLSADIGYLTQGEKPDSRFYFEIVSFKRDYENMSHDFIYENQKTKAECFPELKIPIELMGLPEHYTSRLVENGYFYVSDICLFSFFDFKDLPQVGDKKAKEMFNYLKDFGGCRSFEYGDEEKYQDENFIRLLAVFENCKFNFRDKKIRSQLGKIPIPAYRLELSDILERAEIVSIFKKACLRVITESADSKCFLNDLISRFSRELQTCGFAEEIVDKLIADGDVIIESEYIVRKYPSIDDFSATIKNVRNRKIFNYRMLGETLETIGNRFDFSRERTRQLLKKVGKPFFRLEEDKYKYFFETYDFSDDEFYLFSKESPKVLNYLKWRFNKNKKLKPLELVLEDEHFSISFKQAVERYLFRDYIQVGSTVLKKERMDFVRYVVKTYVKQKITYRSFAEIYEMFLEDVGFVNNPNFQLTISVKNFLASSEYVLWSNNSNFKYYNIHAIDKVDLFEELGLDEFHDIEISTLKIFKENPEVMKDYQIDDEYELHNLLKKLYSNEKSLDIKFKRMPTILFGEASREQQMIELLFELAPIKQADFASAYEERYGIKSQSFLGGGYIECIDKYLGADRFYNVDILIPSSDILSEMKSVFTKDFYLLENLKKRYLEYFPDGNPDYINSYTLKALGYNLYSEYILKKKYSILDEYLEQTIFAQDIFDLKGPYLDLKKSCSFCFSIKQHMSNYDIIEYSKNQYINIKRLEKFSITKKDLQDYCDFIYRNESDSCFTVYSSRKKGLSHPLYKLGFDDYFYASILVENKKLFSSQKLGNNRVFFKGEAGSFVDLIELIVYSQECLYIDTYDLVDIFRDKYNLKIDRYKIVEQIKNSDLYYSLITKKVYADYDVYFDTI